MQLFRLIATQRSNASSVSCEQFGVAAGKADADIVVQDVDPAPARHGVGDHRLDLGILGDVGLEGHGRALFSPIMSTVSCADARL